MLGLSLLCHPDTPSGHVASITVDIGYDDGEDLLLTFHVDGEDYLKLPEWVSATRTDGLWQSTCFEAFIKPEAAEAYFEYNFSPSTQWAAYRFDSYREGMKPLPLSVEPHIARGVGPADPEDFVIEVDLDLSDLPNTILHLALSAVIEQQDGTKSYWALKHPPGKPDFHHPDCFALTLKAPERA